VAFTLHKLSRCCADAGDVAQAKPLLQRALSIFETSLGRTHPQTATILQDLASLASMAGQTRQATALAERAATAAVAAKRQPCGSCGVVGAPGASKCAVCKVVWYCNAACQKRAWKAHKAQCHAKPSVPSAAEKEHVCGECGKVGAPLECSVCELVSYCDAECQGKAWKVHKKECRASTSSSTSAASGSQTAFSSSSSAAAAAP
jgi:hypothetical protein